jgi:hypothetical protein
MTKLILAIAVAVTLAVVGVIAEMWISLSDVSISVAGYIALCGGCVLTFAVGTGLMFLIFYSNRAGFDAEPQVRMGDLEHGKSGRPASYQRKATKSAPD